MLGYGLLTPGTSNVILGSLQIVDGGLSINDRSRIERDALCLTQQSIAWQILKCEESTP